MPVPQGPPRAPLAPYVDLPAYPVGDNDPFARLRRPPPSKGQSFTNVFLWTWLATTIGTGICGGICLLIAGPLAIFGALFGTAIGFVLGIPVGFVVAGVTVRWFHPLSDPVPYRRCIEALGAVAVFSSLGVANLIATLNELEQMARWPGRDANSILAWDAWSMSVSLVVAFFAARFVAKRYISDWNATLPAMVGPNRDPHHGYGYGIGYGYGADVHVPIDRYGQQP